MKLLNIGRVAQLTGLTTATIRYYESKGLITPAGRKGLTRIYEPEVLTRLSLIILAKQGHFSLDEIAVMLSELPEKGIERTAIKEKIAEIDDKILELQKLKQGLLHIEQCPAENHLECPNFRKILAVSLKKNREKMIKTPS
ncbi:MerR family transcriptional regulator [Morganella psychrotolerans]|uniref:MerR family transcriptional regulator n=1 Tax=Morganella psychrotolerans TaxID=368603 RepID=A0A5M9RAI1_9GAMM|nr:MerR family transcriptional regulator [Morganella psychrotolerans]KAA8717277.1 MerR family transcriptional regulator [Morganella psychrotolerans]OBU08435.1 transcriptional regulator [Morganella psychrotolerans]